MDVMSLFQDHSPDYKSLVDVEKDAEEVTEEEDADDAHEDHGQVVFLATSGLVVDGDLCSPGCKEGVTLFSSVDVCMYVHIKCMHLYCSFHNFGTSRCKGNVVSLSICKEPKALTVSCNASSLLT